MDTTTIHARFKHFVEANLMQSIDAEGTKLYKAYAEFAKLKWDNKLFNGSC